MGLVLLGRGTVVEAALAGVAEARACSVPVLVFSTESAPTSADSYFKFVARLAEGDGAGLDDAIKACLQVPAGPVLVEPVEGPSDETMALPAAIPEPDSDEIAQAALLLGLAARPVIWAGGGVTSSRATAELEQIAELIQAPVVTTWMGKGTFNESHELALGATAYEPESRELLSKADLLLAVGTSFNPGESLRNPDLPSQLIQVDTDPARIGERFPVRLGINGDARGVLSAIIEPLKARLAAKAAWAVKRPKPPDPAPSIASTVDAIRTAARARARMQWPDQIGLVDAVRRGLPPDAVMVLDPGSYSNLFGPFFDTTAAGTWICPTGHTRGFSLPAAIGAAASAASGPVVALCEPGGFFYRVSELAALAQSSASVTVGVFAAGERAGSPWQGLDIAAIAQSFGVAATRATGAEQVEAAFCKVVKAGGPHLIEISGS
jgi:acetolactate synthase-1/2/3 large subunit